MLTKSLARELAAHGIRVNAVAPGPVATAFTGTEVAYSLPLRDYLKTKMLIPRPARPEEIAAAMAFLLSEDASFITGIHHP